MLFQPEPSLTFLDVDPAHLAALYQSVNQTAVLVPGEASAMARAVVVGHRQADGFDVVIGLHLVESGRHLIFRRGDPSTLDGEGARDAARDALAFVESMGFFMENVNWKQLGPDDRVQLLAELKVFAPPPARVAETRRSSDPRTKLARLLVQL